MPKQRKSQGALSDHDVERLAREVVPLLANHLTRAEESVPKAATRPSRAEESAPNATARPLAPSKRGIVERRGRLLADGSRRGGGESGRITVYLPPELVSETRLRAARGNQSLSEIVAGALTEHYRRSK